ILIEKQGRYYLTFNDHIQNRLEIEQQVCQIFHSFDITKYYTEIFEQAINLTELIRNSTNCQPNVFTQELIHMLSNLYQTITKKHQFEYTNISQLRHLQWKINILKIQVEEIIHNTSSNYINEQLVKEIFDNVTKLSTIKFFTFSRINQKQLNDIMHSQNAYFGLSIHELGGKHLNEIILEAVLNGIECDDKRVTEVKLAMKWKRFDLVERYMLTMKTIHKWKDEELDECLEVALLLGSVEFVELLLQFGASFNRLAQLGDIDYVMKKMTTKNTNHVICNCGCLVGSDFRLIAAALL
ncbi:unnamed protein product, partial [Didymodactylos carnosus]